MHEETLREIANRRVRLIALQMERNDLAHRIEEVDKAIQVHRDAIIFNVVKDESIKADEEMPFE